MPDKPFEFAIKVEPDEKEKLKENPIEKFKNAMTRTQQLFPHLLLSHALTATIMKSKYDAYIKVGFTPEQALYLCKDEIKK